MIKKFWTTLFLISGITTVVNAADYSILEIVVSPQGKLQYVHRLSSASVGLLLDLDTNTVNGITASNGDVFTYNSTSGVWYAKTPTGGGGSDNLGSHVATGTVYMNGYTLEGSTGIHITSSAVGALVIGTETAPTAFFHITSTSGDSRDQIIVSTGTTVLFKVGTGNTVIGTTETTIIGRLSVDGGNTATPGINFLGNNTSGIEFDSGGNMFYINTSGTRRVGIGSSFLKLYTGYIDVDSGGSLVNPALWISDDTSGATGKGLYSPSSNSGVLGFITKSIERGRIGADGNWGIGTGTGAVISNLHVSSVNASVNASLFSVSTGAPNGNNVLFAVGTTSMTINIPGVTLGGALCINASKQLSKCTDAPDASGNCTCP